MKFITATAALAAAALAPTLAYAGLDSGNPVHPLVGIAITGGGDKLSSVELQYVGSQSVTAGGLVQVYGGVEYHEKGSPVGVQATLGYHFDSINARNGSQRFERFPIEVIGLVNATPKFRVGLGARYAMAAKFTSDGAGDVGNGEGPSDFNFKSQLGGLVMAEWLITQSMGLQLRYVHEKYKLDGATIDGSHGGLGFNYYF
jgi:hypothetical protein